MNIPANSSVIYNIQDTNKKMLKFECDNIISVEIKEILKISGTNFKINRGIFTSVNIINNNANAVDVIITEE